MKTHKGILEKIILFFIIACILLITACSLSPNSSIGNSDIEKELPSVANYDALLDLLKKMRPTGIYYAARDGMMLEKSESADNAASAGESGGSDYSGTNVQVQGVDESDIVKTDGEYIYYVNMNKIIISKVFPAEQMEVINTISFENGTFNPFEIYVDDKYLVAIGNNYHYTEAIIQEKDDAVIYDKESEKEEIITSEETGDIEPADIDGRRAITYYRGRDTVKVMIYDISNPEKTALVRNFEVEGNYVSSRKIDSELYIIGNRYLYYSHDNPDESEILPWYRDEKVSEDFTAVEYEDIRYFPDGQESGYLMIASLDLDKINEKIDVNAYLGSAQTIYSSADNLYITVPVWKIDEAAVRENKTVVETATAKAPEIDSATNDTESISVEPDVIIRDEPFIAPVYNEITTQIYRFTLKKGKASFASKGEVPGTLLNQFSMDEYKNTFRVATTKGNVWFEGESASQNNLYVLDMNLDITGRIENIAPGERIYSVRFMGDRGYMVTFRTMDPLFVLDLKDPVNPTILGELKIPGYSGYLHPYDEDHIIGFGMDTEVVQIKDRDGKIIREGAVQTGVKIAMFDVSDVSNPVEKHKVIIGGRGTYSELLYNHKALLFSKEKSLMAFPINVTSENSSDYEFEFQGFYVYNLDLDNGFVLSTRITHMLKEDGKKADNEWFDYRQAVERGLYIEDVLYTLSKSFIKASSLETFEEIGAIDLR